MLEWCMAHPWLTFWIIITAIICLDNSIANVFRYLNNRLRVRCAEKGITAREKEE